MPAGFNTVIYEPSFALNAARDGFASEANETRRSVVEAPLPVGISFWAGVGEEPVLLKVASAYETATRHRAAPKAFGPVKTGPRLERSKGAASAGTR